MLLLTLAITVTARDNGITEVCGTPVGGDAISGELGAAEAVTALLVEFFKIAAARTDKTEALPATSVARS